jgi:D-amino-acid dehydrogenase
MARIWVIGGGVIGAASAVRLSQAGWEVGLVDPGDEQARASFGNAGQVCPELSEPLASWGTARSAFGRLFAFGGPLDFRWTDIGLWGPWALRYLAACRSDRFHAGTQALAALQTRTVPAWRELLASIGHPELLLDLPHRGLWESKKSLAAGLAGLRAANLGPASVRPLNEAEVARLAEVFAGLPKGGALIEGAAKLSDPADVVRALHAALKAAGGEVITGRVERLRTDLDHVWLELDGGDVIEAAMVLIAAGARSAPLARQAGLTAPLLAERGYHLTYPEHDWPDDLGPMVFEDRGVFLTRHTSGVRMTGFTEIGHPDAPPDPRKWRMLERHVRELDVPVRGEPRRWMGARPSLPDFLPAIGRKGSVLYAFGHQHIGMTLGAATAEAVVELAASNTTPERLKPFGLERFG